MLEITNVYKSYDEGHHFVVSDINLSVYDGECLAIVGQAGGGKTTLLRMINRLIEPSSGEIHIKGELASNEAIAKIRKSAGYLSDQTCLFPHLSIFENINIAHHQTIKDLNIRSQLTFELMARLKLDPFKLADSYTEDLSQSENFRVILARMLATEPDILLLDNPFLNIDAVARIDLMQELLTLKQGFNKTIVFATDDLSEARLIADKIAILLEGRILQLGSYTELRAAPKHEHVSHYIEQIERER